jgi:2,4-dienoyl-CoA reductase-like NADH-dependent reductase (Old Yellow Enzyme family)
LEKAYSPTQLGHVMLRNRFIKTATYEGFYRDGQPTAELTQHHVRLAKGGVAMTTLSYGAVSNMGRTHKHQMIVSNSSLPFLEKFTKAVKKEGAAVSIQLTHCGFFSSNSTIKKDRPRSPSRTLNLYGLLQGLGISRPMSIGDMDQTSDDFATAAKISKEAGFDAIELHMGHGYLLSQFISPHTNRRKDRYGGTLENRMRFPLEVIEKVRHAVGQEFPVLCKINMSDGFKGGLEISEAIDVAKALEMAGVNALVLSGGFTSKTPFYLMRGGIPVKDMIEVEKDRLQKWAFRLFGHLIIKEYAFEENFFMPLAKKIRAKVKIPLVYLGGVSSTDGISQVMSEGFDMIAIGRALIHNPDFILKARHENYTSPCDHCNKCVAEMDREGIRCVLEQEG